MKTRKIFAKIKQKKEAIIVVYIAKRSNGENAQTKFSRFVKNCAQ